MSFSDLLDEIEANDVSQLPTPIVGVDRDLVPSLKRVTAQDRFYFVEADLDREISFGHFKRFRERDGVYVDPQWVTEVRYAAGLNWCWRRFVCVKELMHAFDTEAEQANTPEKFRTLLNELELRPPDPSQMLNSENRAVWRAMAALAPASLVVPHEEDYKAGNISDYDVALSLRIPKFYVPHIMDETFPRIVGLLREL
jgi:hypothetical protein